MKIAHSGARQKGITLIGFVFILIVLGFFAYLGMRIVPMYIEYFSVVKSIKHVASQPGIGTADETKIRDLLSREFDIGYVDSIKDKDVKIKRLQNAVELSVDYEVRKPGAYNIDLVGHFQKTVASTGASDASP
jgi:hypothetical protein